MAPREVQPPRTTAEIGPRRAAAKKVRDDLFTALGQEGLTEAEYTAIQTQYTAAKKQYNLLDDLYGEAEDKEKLAGRESKGLASQKVVDDTATKSKIKLSETAAIKAANIFKGDPNDKNKKNNKDVAYQTLNDLYDKADASGVVLPRIIAPIEGGGFGLVNAAPAAAVETVVTPTVATPQVLTAAESEVVARTGRQLPDSTAVETSDTATTDTILASRQSLAYQKAYVDAQLKAKGLADTPENRKTLRAAYQALSPKEKTAATSGIVQYGTNVPPAEDNRGDAAVNQKAYVDAQLKAKGLADTPENRKTLRAAYQALTPEEKIAAVAAVPGANAPAGDMAWMEIFRKDYPAYSDWTTSEVTEHFGQDFMDILNNIVTGKIEYSDEEIKALLKNTKYFNSITDKQYFFDTQRKSVQDDLVATARRSITTDYADVGLSEADLVDLSKTVARSGLTGTGLKQAVYQHAFRRAAAAPMATDTKMATNALQGADADAIRQNARAYGYAVSDAEVQAALTGGMYNGVAVSSESILQKAQKAAKGAYGHLSDQIDSGLSLDDIFSQYKQYASEVLELDGSKIDFMKDPKWQTAFGTKESGQMGLGDWVAKLKTDTNYGWQFTKQANQQATDIGMVLARAFGKVR